MRTNGQFIHQLRDEIQAGQVRRSSYIKAKLAFVVSLLGLGAISLKGMSQTSHLLYLVLIVTFVFDLYILGEDFGIKRAGAFIQTSPATPLEERAWEISLALKRDWFSYFANILSSFIAMLAASVGIYITKTVAIPFVLWLLFGLSGLVFLSVVTLYRFIRIKSMNNYISFLEKFRREPRYYGEPTALADSKNTAVER
jgi:hypothetical protein